MTKIYLYVHLHRIMLAFGESTHIDIKMKHFRINHNNLDKQVDTLRTATVTMLQQFGLDEATIKVLKRGAPPLGGGSVLFTCSIVRELKPIDITEVCT